MDFIRGQNTPYFSRDFDFKIWFQARQVTGSFEKWAPGPYILVFSRQTNLKTKIIFFK